MPFEEGTRKDKEWPVPLGNRQVGWADLLGLVKEGQACLLRGVCAPSLDADILDVIGGSFTLVMRL